MNLAVASMELLTMRQLVEASGVPRSTVQFYTREGVLPPPQRLPNNRAIYGRVHVDLLAQIGWLKAEGLSLDEIRPLLKETAASSGFYRVDLAQELDAATRARILEAAADEFGKKGYRRARLSDVIKQAGVTPQVLASHFPSKKQLFAESFAVAGQRATERAIRAMERERDLRRKLLARFDRLLRLRRGADATVWALARAEALYEGGEPAEKAQQVYRTISALHVAELERLRTLNAQTGAATVAATAQPAATPTAAAAAEPAPQGTWPPVSDELMAYCFLGAEEYLIERLAWDDSFTREDALKAYLLLIAAVHAQYDAGLDVKDCWDSYREALETRG